MQRPPLPEGLAERTADLRRLQAGPLLLAGLPEGQLEIPQDLLPARVDQRRQLRVPGPHGLLREDRGARTRRTGPRARDPAPSLDAGRHAVIPNLPPLPLPQPNPRPIYNLTATLSGTLHSN